MGFYLLLKTLSKFIFVATLVSPLSLSNYSFSPQEGMSLKMSKSSPPLAILEDEVIYSASSEARDFGTPEVENLDHISKRESLASFARGITEEKSLGDGIEVRRVLKTARQLGGMRLNKTSTNINVLMKSYQQTETYESKTEIISQSIKENNDRGEGTRPLAYSEEKGFQRDQDQIDESIEKSSPSLASVDFLSMGSTEGAATRRIARKESGAKLLDGANYKSENKNQEEGPLFADNFRGQKDVAMEGPQILKGKIEIEDGLALTDAHQLVVYQEAGGERYGEGQVFPGEGTFEIYVNDIRRGTLVAELKDGEQILGRSEILLSSLKTLSPLLEIHALERPVIAQVESAYGQEGAMFQKDVQILTSGMNLGQEKVLSSSVISSATKPGYWGSLMLGSSSEKLKHVLYADKTIEALSELVSRKISKDGGLIRGVVRISGKPIAGATVEIESESKEKPIYFNAFLPSEFLQETTGNGEFIFTNIPRGSYVVKAKYKGRSFSPRTLVVERGYITRADFDTNVSSRAELFVFDMESSKEVSAQIGFLGSDKKMRAEGGHSQISFSGEQGIQFLDIIPENSELLKARMTLNKSTKEIFAPVVHKEWLAKIASETQTTILPEASVMVGLARETPFSVELDSEAYNEATKVFYFDERGDVLVGATAAPAGGGVVAFNINVGLRTLVAKGINLKNQITTMAAETGFVNIYNSNL